MTRQPRPAIPVIPRPRDAWWALILSAADVACTEGGDELIGLTLGSIRFDRRVEGGRFDGWYWFATYESRQFDHPDYRKHEVLEGQRYCAAEVRDSGETTALDLPPVTSGDLRMWLPNLPQRGMRAPEFAASQPLVGIDREMGSTGDARSGLGVPCAIPTPAASLISVLRLHGSEDLTLRADAGLGLGLVTWRADYDISDYHLPNANTTGCGIVIRPDLLDDLLQRLGPRLIIATS